MMRFMSLVVSAAMTVAAIPAGNMPARAVKVGNAIVSETTGTNINSIYAELAVKSFVYNGSVRKPQVTVKDGDWVLEEGKEYTVTCGDAVDAGDYTLTVTGIGAYSGSKVLSYTITPTDLIASGVSIESRSYTYDGTAKTPAVTVKFNGNNLVEGKDYTVSYTDNLNVGSSSSYAVVEGKGNYRGTVKKSFSIVAADISKAQMTLSETSYTYDGNAKTPTATIVLGTRTLISGTDYTLSYKNNNVVTDSAVVTATGKGNYTGKLEAVFEIKAAAQTEKSIADANVMLAADTFTYNGLEQKPGVTVKDGATTLSAGTDYTVSYSNNIQAGTAATVTVTGKGNYKGSKAVTFAILPKKLTAADMTLSENRFTYDGSEKRPAVTVRDGSSVVSTSEYGVAYSNNVEVGNGTVTVTDKEGGNYEIRGVLTFEIVQDESNEHKLTLVPEKKATCTEDGKKAYYTCSHCDKIFADAEGKTETTEAALVVKAEGHKLTAHAEVKASCTEDGKKAYWECSECKKIFADAEGKNETTEAALVVKAQGHKLTHVEAVEATVDKEGNTEYWTCSECGKFFKDAEGKEEITEEETKVEKKTEEETTEETEEEKPVDIASATVTGLGTKAWTGSAVEPVVTVKLDGKTLKKGTDYTVAYSNNTGAGSATVIISGRGEYNGTVQKRFVIKKAALKYRAYVQKKNWMSWTTAGIGTKVDAKKFAGTTDNLRMETIQMQLSGIGGAVKYRAYVEKMGWTQWATTADKTTFAGTKGMSRRVEMIQLSANGQVANLYDMYYRTYCEKFGWLGWAGNNEKSGSAGYARKLEAFQIQFVPKGTKFNKGTKQAFYDSAKDGK